MNINNNLELALKVAKESHAGMFRKNGKSYFEDHIMGIQDLIKDYPDDYKTVMALHDVVEDTKTNEEYLRTIFSQDLIDDVMLLTLDKSLDEGEEVKKCLKTKRALIGRYFDRLQNLMTTNTDDLSFVEKMVSKTEKYYLPVFEGNKELLKVINIYDMYRELDRLKRALSPIQIGVRLSSKTCFFEVTEINDSGYGKVKQTSCGVCGDTEVVDFKVSIFEERIKEGTLILEDI